MLVFTYRGKKAAQSLPKLDIFPFCSFRLSFVHLLRCVYAFPCVIFFPQNETIYRYTTIRWDDTCIYTIIRKMPLTCVFGVSENVEAFLSLLELHHKQTDYELKRIPFFELKNCLFNFLPFNRT